MDAILEERVDRQAMPAELPAGAARRAWQSLPAKGACWYCDRQLDNVKRFCGKTCLDPFEEEAARSEQPRESI